MKFTVVIPARYASTRLPGKPLADIQGQPMIQRVYRQALKSQADAVIIATDDPRIEAAVKAFGGRCCLTRADHPSGTDRLQEVAAQLGLADDAIIVNVQGDEPLIPPQVIDQVAENLATHPEAQVSTLSEPIKSVDELFDPNAVKVVSDQNGLALYFSRASIPWDRDRFAKERCLPAGDAWQRHVGIYGYRVGLLNRFVDWPQAPLETIECLEQLRVLYQGERIHVAQACEAIPAGVDTPEDLARVCQLLATGSAA